MYSREAQGAGGLNMAIALGKVAGRTHIIQNKCSRVKSDFVRPWSTLHKAIGFLGKSFGVISGSSTKLDRCAADGDDKEAMISTAL